MVLKAADLKAGDVHGKDVPGPGDLVHGGGGDPGACEQPAPFQVQQQTVDA